MNIVVDDFPLPVPMPKTIAPADINKFLDSVKQFVFMAKSLVSMFPIPNKAVILQVLDAVDKFVDKARPVVSEVWFSDLANFLVQLFEKKDKPEEMLKMLKDAFVTK